MNNEPNNHHRAESQVVARRCIPETTIHKMCLMNTWINMSAVKLLNKYLLLLEPHLLSLIMLFFYISKTISSSSLDLN